MWDLYDMVNSSAEIPQVTVQLPEWWITLQVISSSVFLLASLAVSHQRLLLMLEKFVNYEEIQ